MINDYKGWTITKINETSWKATKGAQSINCCNPALLKAIIDEEEMR